MSSSMAWALPGELESLVDWKIGAEDEDEDEAEAEGEDEDEGASCFDRTAMREGNLRPWPRTWGVNRETLLRWEALGLNKKGKGHGGFEIRRGDDPIMIEYYYWQWQWQHWHLFFKWRKFINLKGILFSECWKFGYCYCCSLVWSGWTIESWWLSHIYFHFLYGRDYPFFISFLLSFSSAFVINIFIKNENM